MSTDAGVKVSNAIDRRPQRLDPALAALYRNILSSDVARGRSLSRSEIASQVHDVDAAIDVFKVNDMVVFEENDEPSARVSR